MLQACPECGKKYSTTAKTCPACGFAPGKAAAFWWKLIGGLLVFGGATAALFYQVDAASLPVGFMGAMCFIVGIVVFVIGRFKE